MQVTSLNNPIGPLPADEKLRLKEASEQFEAVWLAQLLKEARPEGSELLGDSYSSRLYKDMMDDVLAQEMAKSHTFGLAELLTRQMQPTASHSSSSGAAGNTEA
jgi:flagellar protein FlgJ